MAIETIALYLKLLIYVHYDARFTDDTSASFNAISHNQKCPKARKPTNLHKTATKLQLVCKKNNIAIIAHVVKWFPPSHFFKTFSWLHIII